MRGTLDVPHFPPYWLTVLLYFFRQLRPMTLDKWKLGRLFRVPFLGKWDWRFRHLRLFIVRDDRLLWAMSADWARKGLARFRDKRALLVQRLLAMLVDWADQLDMFIRTKDLLPTVTGVAVGSGVPPTRRDR